VVKSERKNAKYHYTKGVSKRREMAEKDYPES
jgi:hypothetical protein